MSETRTNYQIVRKDAKDCFIESLNDAFDIGKIHFGFVAYDPNRPEGDRQVSKVDIYVAADEFLELCRKLNRGEIKYQMLEKKKKQGPHTNI